MCINIGTDEICHQDEMTEYAKLSLRNVLGFRNLYAYDILYNTYIYTHIIVGI